MMETCYPDGPLLYNVRVQWFVSCYLTSFPDDQFEAAKGRMTDLYNALHKQFSEPEYWPDKAQSYYPLYGAFMKV